MADYMLITQGTQPFAQRLGRQLAAGRQVLFGAADGLPEVLLRSGNYVRLPHVDTSAFTHEMLKVCLDHGVTHLVPLGISELRPLLEAKILFGEYGVSVLLPDSRVFDELTHFENPPAQLPLVVLEDGKPIDQLEPEEIADASLSGVYVRSDSGDTFALCCLSD